MLVGLLPRRMVEDFAAKRMKVAIAARESQRKRVD
jgi:hypothetical protein